MEKSAPQFRVKGPGERFETQQDRNRRIAQEDHEAFIASLGGVNAPAEIHERWAFFRNEDNKQKLKREREATDLLLSRAEARHRERSEAERDLEANRELFGPDSFVDDQGFIVWKESVVNK